MMTAMEKRKNRSSRKRLSTVKSDDIDMKASGTESVDSLHINMFSVQRGILSTLTDNERLITRHLVTKKSQTKSFGNPVLNTVWIRKPEPFGFGQTDFLLLNVIAFKNRTSQIIRTFQNQKSLS
jgi:hypothetical protein